jgi:hypothetical protein
MTQDNVDATGAKSGDYETAVTALARLPLDAMRQAYSTAAAPGLRAQASAVLGRCKSGLGGAIKGMVGGGPWASPAFDNAELWSRGKSVALVSHPSALGLDDLRAIVDAADNGGLDVMIDAASWHSPGQALRIEWRVKTRGK